MIIGLIIAVAIVYAIAYIYVKYGRDGKIFEKFESDDYSLLKEYSNLGIVYGIDHKHKIIRYNYKMHRRLLEVENEQQNIKR